MTMLDERRVPFWKGIANLAAAAGSRLYAPGMWVTLALLAVIAYACISYARALSPITLVVDGQPTPLRTHCATVGDLLADAGIILNEWDTITPVREAAVQDGLVVTIEHAHPVTITADGATWMVYTHSQAADDIVREAGLTLDPRDRLWVNDQLMTQNPIHLSTHISRTASSRGTSPAILPHISQIKIERAASLYLHDSGVIQTLRTTTHTIGQALLEAGVTLYLGDRIYPGLDAPLNAGLHIYIQRGKWVLIAADGRTLRVRTQATTVQQALAEAGVVLVGQDMVAPGLEAEIADGLHVEVVRVTEKTIIEQEEIPFQTQWIADGALELDQKRVDNAGANGVTRRRYKAVYHNGQEVERYLEDEWTALEPQTRQIAYGTKIVIRTLEAEDGSTIQYWRRLRVFLTSYTEATCGKTPDDLWYGKTRLGWDMRRGIIAVDPRVIPMLTEMYVPSYGHGIAADTGGMIKGMHIDLGHDVDNFVMYYWWGYVYLLAPTPPASQIRWILPEFPKER